MTAEPWFVAEPGDWAPDRVLLPPDESHHALSVLRLEMADPCCVTDGAGVVARGALAGLDGGRATVSILERAQHARPRPEMVVYQGAATRHKIDDVIERLAELGIAEVVVFRSARAVARWDERKHERMQQRWRAIARAAAKQSRSPFVLRPSGVISWDALVRAVGAEPEALVLWEEASAPLRTGLGRASERIALVVGPEGGLTVDEAGALAEANARLVTLGPRILRTENAAFAAASALLWHHGLFG